jgi:hypothetical protein
MQSYRLCYLLVQKTPTEVDMGLVIVMVMVGL